MRIPTRVISASALALALGGAMLAFGGASTPANAVAAEQFLVATGAGPGGGPHVKLFKPSNGQNVISFFAFAPSFSGGVNVAMGDLDGDGVLEIIAAAGPGGGPHVRVFTDHGVPIDKWSFFAYDTAFTGGVNVGVSDVDGDGDDEIVTAPAGNGGPHVKVWNIVSDKAALKAQFFAYDPNFTGGVSVAGSYLDETANEGIVTGAGPGGGPNVKTFNASGTVSSFFAYDPLYRGGVSVASQYSENADNIDEILTTSMSGRGHVRSFFTNGASGAVSFFAFGPGIETGGVIASIDGASNGPIVVGPHLPGSGTAFYRGFQANGTPTVEGAPYGALWTKGISVAGGFGSFDSAGTIPTTTTTSTTIPPTTTTSTTIPPTTTTT